MGRHTSPSDPVPNRSSKGCLTCRQRKKKCDERKPECERCALGGFNCLGYSHLSGSKALLSKHRDNDATHIAGTSSPLFTQNEPASKYSPEQDSSSYSSDQMCWPTTAPENIFSGSPTLDGVGFWQQDQCNTSIYEPKRIPINPQLDPFDLDSMKSLILVQYTRLARRIAFRPFSYPVELGLTNYLVRGSHLICKTLYLGARISQALLDDTNWQGYIGWIDTFHNRILGTQSALVESNVGHLADRLASNCNLAVYAFMILNSSIGYTIFRKGAPMFLQLAVKYPDLWTGDSAISLSRALHGPRHELGKFTLMDTVSALSFGIAPLIHYDTTLGPNDHRPRKDLFLEPAFACPIVVLIALARVNAHRASRLMNQDATSADGLEECEAAVRKWKAPVDYNDQPSKIVTRLAVQEAWRQAALIYLYMGMCEARSCDGRVGPLVQQVAQLASAIEAGSPLETHLFIPCLIAGVAARKERHRAILRKKIQASQKTDACLLRGADFSFVLDHLWHGTGSGGSPVTWDDYVNSRCLVLPIPAEV